MICPHSSLTGRSIDVCTRVKIGAQLWRRSGSWIITGWPSALIARLRLGERQHDSHLESPVTRPDACGKSLAVRRRVGGGGGRVQFRALLAARHRRHAVVLHARRTRPGRSSSFVSSIRRTRPEASGTAASRRASFAAPRSTPTASRGRTTRSAGTGSIRRRSCSIPTRRRCSSRRSSAAKRARKPGPTDGRAPLGRLPSKEDGGPSDRDGPAIHLPRRHRL